MKQEDSLSLEAKAIANHVAPPSIVYHYTTPTGLLGIVNSQKIWATDLAYMNDAAELSYGIKLVLKTANALLDSRTQFIHSQEFSPLSSSMLNYAFDAIRQLLSTCIACFCEKGDPLSQWRGYAVAGGYAIGFDGAKLRTSTASTVTLPLVPVIYDLAQQRQAVENSTEQALTQILELIAELNEKYEAGRSFAGLEQSQLSENMTNGLRAGLISLTQEHFLTLFKLCAQLKDPAFREEREWRLCNLVAIEDKHINFRVGHLGLIPYTQIPLSTNTTLPIKEVVIGPRPEPELRVGAVRSMLTRRGYPTNDIDIRPSIIPFRPHH